jgi:hypothetical protein
VLLEAGYDAIGFDAGFQAAELGRVNKTLYQSI